MAEDLRSLLLDPNGSELFATVMELKGAERKELKERNQAVEAACRGLRENTARS